MLSRLRGSWRLGIVALLSAGAAQAQFEDRYEPNPAAAKKFEELVEAYRDRPALHLKSELTVKLIDGEQIAQPDAVAAELLYVKEVGGRVRIRAFTCYFSEGVFYAVHDDTAHSYFRSEYMGSPYYELFFHFQDLPYPELALLWGEDAMDEVWMQLHSQTPLLVPTEVSEVDHEGTTRRRLVLSCPNGRLEMLIDPKTSLIESMSHEISGGFLVEAGTKRATEYKLEYFEDARDDLVAAITFEPGDRQRVDSLMALLPPPQVAAGGPGAQAPGVGPGDEAPNFVLATLDNDAIDLEDLRGKVVVLDFWATWCGPCKLALPELQRLASWARDEQLPVEIITINAFEKSGEKDSPDARRESTQAFRDAAQLTLPIAMDYSDQTGLAYGVTGIPSTFVIRSDGIIYEHVPFGPSYFEDLKRDVQGALEALEVEEDEEPAIID